MAYDFALPPLSSARAGTVLRREQAHGRTLRHSRLTCPRIGLRFTDYTAQMFDSPTLTVDAGARAWATASSPEPAPGCTLRTGTARSLPIGCRHGYEPNLGCYLQTVNSNQSIKGIALAAAALSLPFHQHCASSAPTTKPRQDCAANLPDHSPAKATASGWASPACSSPAKTNPVTNSKNESGERKPGCPTSRSFFARCGSTAKLLSDCPGRPGKQSRSVP